MTTPQGERSFKVTLSCVTDQNNDAAGVVAVLHDVTKEKEVAEMKNDFVSSVSHELRTPLASIKAYVEMLIDGEADDEKTKREFYEVIQGRGESAVAPDRQHPEHQPHRIRTGEGEQAAAEPDGHHQGSAAR